MFLEGFVDFGHGVVRVRVLEGWLSDESVNCGIFADMGERVVREKVRNQGKSRMWEWWVVREKVRNQEKSRMREG